MTDYVSVRSNWSSTNSISLEQISDVILEEENQSTEADNQDTDDHLRLVHFFFYFEGVKCDL